MKNYKYFRVLVCLLLVCCLIVNVSPIKAHAVGVDWILRQIATDIGVTGILEGLGLFRDTLNGDEYYNDLVSDVKDHLATTGQVTGEYIDAYWRIDPLNANPVLTIPLALISAVHNYIFDNGVVTDSYSGITELQISVCEDAIAQFEEWFSFSNPYCILYEIGNGNLSLGCSKYPFTLDSDGIYRCYSGSTKMTFKIFTIYPDYFVAHDGVSSSFNPSGKTVRLFRGSSPISTYNPILLGTIAPSGTLFTSAYPQWVEHQKEEEDGSTVPMVQIGLGNSVGETESLTQEQIWAGSGTISVPDTEEDEAHVPVTLPEWLQQGLDNLRLGLQDISSTLLELPAAIAEKVAAVFIPSTDYLTAKVEALRGEFGFIDSVIATGEFIRDSVSGASGPPVIYVDLGRAPSGNYGTQRVLLTDFSWYAPYKGQVDTVLSAALWAFFGWRVFMKLPGIIGGESGYISDVFFSSSSGRSGSDDKKKGGKG